MKNAIIKISNLVVVFILVFTLSGCALSEAPIVGDYVNQQTQALQDYATAAILGNAVKAAQTANVIGVGEYSFEQVSSLIKAFLPEGTDLSSMASWKITVDENSVTITNSEGNVIFPRP